MGAEVLNSASQICVEITLLTKLCSGIFVFLYGLLVLIRNDQKLQCNPLYLFTSFQKTTYKDTGFTMGFSIHFFVIIDPPLIIQSQNPCPHPDHPFQFYNFFTNIILFFFTLE